jgi:hypothetical protein
MRRGVYNKFNRGEIDRRALQREDVEKVNNSCSLMTNFLPLRLGPMMYRPGTVYIDELASETYMLPFVAATDDAAIVAVTADDVRVFVDDAVVARAASNLTLANETFDTALTSWTADNGVGASTNWVTGGYAALTGTETTSAKLYQTTGNSGAYIGVEHGIRFVIAEAPVLVKIGESGVDSNDIFEGELGVGVHSFVITPIAAQPTITLVNSRKYRSLVSEVSIEAPGAMVIPLPESIDRLSSIRVGQSADVLFTSTDSTAQFRIERRGSGSWSVVKYRANDGPFGLINNSDITLTAADLDGNTTLTASDSLFTTSSVGKLYKLSSSSQQVSASVTAQDSGTNSIRVTGVGASRLFTVTISGVWSGTVTLQRSSDDASWQDVKTYVVNGSEGLNYGLDNQVLYYRLWIKSGDYTSGTANLDIQYSGGSIDGICRVTGYTSSTVVDVQVYSDFGSTDATRDWFEGEWSDDAGHPSATSLYEGRLWWAGRNKIWGSVSDEFGSFDSEIEGDSKAIRKTIGFGPVDRVEWLAPSSRLLIGVASDEISVRSSSFGEILSQNNTNLKSGSTQGAAPIEPLKLDDSIIYVQRSGIKLMDSAYSLDADNHKSGDLTILNPDIGSPGIKRIASSRQPETRVYAVLDNGEMRVYLREPTEDVKAWSRITTDGTIDDVIVLPGSIEDRVYIIVTRSGGRYVERLSPMADVVDEHFDSAVVLTSPGSTITGLSHLEGETVGVWADGQDRGTYTVAAGSITVPAAYADVVVGLPYIADYRSNKLGGYIEYSTQGRRKRVSDIHLAMVDYWPGAIHHGPDFNTLESMPGVEYGADVDDSVVVEEYDEPSLEFNGENEVDPRICLRATGPCTILSMTYGILQDGDSSRNES